MAFSTFKFYLRPNAQQVRNLDRIRTTCCELYNAALEEKRDAYKRQRINLNFNKQSAEMTDVKRERPDVALVHGQVLQNTLKRLHRVFDTFYRRIKAGQKAGFPRFHSPHRHDSFTFPQVSKRYPFRGGGVDLVGGRLKVHGVPGTIRIKWHRKMEGLPKTATFKREGERWYVFFQCADVPARVLPSTRRECGIDLGLNTFAMLDDGTAVENPRFMRHAQGAIGRAQRRVDRRPNLQSNRRRKAVVLLGKRCHRVTNARHDFAHRTSRKLVDSYDRIAVEKLNMNCLTRGVLSKSIYDAGWGFFLRVLSSKAANAGREVVAVDPNGTSQECSGCGAVVRKKLGERTHHCNNCGLVLDRDVNAARNIRARAFGRPGDGLRRGQPEVRAPDDPRSLI